MSSITLDKKLGINPRVVNVHCFVCGEVKSDSLVLLGASNRVDTCPSCGAQIYGGANVKGGERSCPACGHKAYKCFERRTLRDSERIHQNGTCQECQKLMEQGIVMISVDEEKSTDMKNPYRTGGWCVLKEESVRRMIDTPELAEQICRERVCFVPDDAWDQLGLPRGDVKEDEE